MSQIQSGSQVLEEGDAALLAGGQAEVLGEGEEFVDLTKDDDTTAQPPKKEEPAATTAQPPADGEDELPPEYRGKTAKEIAKMHMEAQQAIGRQGSELGELRRWADTLVRSGMAQRRPPAQAAQPAAKAPIEESQVFAKPIETISTLIEQHPVVQQLRRDLGAAAAVEAQRRMMEAKQRFDSAHPDYAEILRDQSFREWVQASPKRRQMMMDANNKYDFDAGDEVFSTWKALNKKPAPAAATESTTAAAPTEAEVSAAAALLAKARAAKQNSSQTAAAAAAAPTGGASAANGKGGKKYYKRADVINLMINDPDRYEQLSAEIQRAYAEGRVK